MGEAYISVSEAAEELGITRQRVLQLIDAGRLKAQKFANIYMIARSDLEEVRERQSGRPPKAKAEKASKKRGGK